MARNSYYDGTSGSDVVVGGSVGQQVLIDTKVAAAQLAQTNAEDARDSALASKASASDSAASALSSKNSVEDIIPIGGSEDSILTKLSSSNYDLEWTSTINAANVDGGYF
jgi:hypothetical protein